MNQLPNKTGDDPTRQPDPTKPERLPRIIDLLIDFNLAGFHLVTAAMLADDRREVPHG